jgi:nucleotide-binding universal stress UspA family protein
VADGTLPIPLRTEIPASAPQRYRSILLVVAGIASGDGIHSGGGASDAPRVASHLAARDSSALRVLSLDGAEHELTSSPDAVAEYVCRTAVHHTSDLIVLDQLPDIGDATPACTARMSIIRRAPTAVLALGAGAREVARDVVLATDFSRASIKAAREALRVAAPRRVHLVHVATTRRALPFGASTNDSATDAATTMLFGAMVPTLAIPPNVQVTCVTLSGDPAGALLEYSDRVQADLIGVGRHGRHGGPSTELGPIAADVTRRARCSVFVPAGGERADRLTVA